MNRTRTRAQLAPTEQLARFADYCVAVRKPSTPEEVLQTAAGAVVACGLYRRVVISLHDEDGNLGPIGSCGIPLKLIEAARHAPPVRKEVRETVLQDRFRIGDSYFVPAEAGIDLSNEGRHIPSLTCALVPGGWQAGDELFTPLRRSDDTVFGFCSVDDPFSGRRPDSHAVKLLDGIVSQAAVTVEDLSLRRDLDAAHQRFTRFLDRCGDVLYELDVINDRFRFFSPSVRELTGLNASEMIGLSTIAWLHRLVHPDDRDRVRARWLSICHHGATGHDPSHGNEYRIVHHNGSIRWVQEGTSPVEDNDGQIIRIEGSLRDVTTLRSLSGKLARTERQYRLMTDNARDLIYARDETGHVFFVSPSVERYLGVTPNEFVGSHFSEWLSDNPINSAAFEVLAAEINERRSVTPYVLELRSRDGHTFVMEFNESLIRDAAGRVVGIQGVGRDVTEREEVLGALRDNRERLNAANDTLTSLVHRLRRRRERAVELSRRLQDKNAELESFVRIVSHDLRSPLISLRGLASQLRRQYASRLDKKGQNIARRLSAEAGRLTRLIGDLLVYAGAVVDPGARRRVDAGLIVDAVWTRLLESDLATGVSFAHPPTSAVVWADPVALERVFENLLGNAVTHRSPDRPANIEIHWERKRSTIRFDIRDNGIGIEPQDCPHVFELFFRGRNVHTEGSGLGLAIVKRIVETSAASITLAPNPAGGSVFTLSWPTQPPSSQNPSPMHNTDLPADSQNGRD